MEHEKDIAITDERAAADYWISRQVKGDEILMTEGEIRQLNGLMELSCRSLVELLDFPHNLEKIILSEMILEAQQDFRSDDGNGEYYDENGYVVGREALRAARDNCALSELRRRNPARYAVTTERADVRLLPTCQAYHDDRDCLHYDLLQGTILDPCEPVIVFHESRDGKFVFLQARHYTGWVLCAALAYTGAEVWERYVHPKDFLVVTENKEYVRVNDSKRIMFQMGGRILLSDIEPDNDGLWRGLVPISDGGRLRELEISIPDNGAFHRGWLPCTLNAWISQAFKFLGDGYGWGGMEESVDCSAFVGAVCRSMGIEIPRDADQQEIVMPHRIDFTGLSRKERCEVLGRVPAGSLIFKPGHVMMHLGTDGSGTPLVIHAASSHFTFDGAMREKHYVRKILVSDLTFKGSKGSETIDDITSVGCFTSVPPRSET